MTQVNMPAAKTTLSELVERAERGETVAKLVPVAKLLRKDLLGIAKGLFTMNPDFDRPMTQKELEEFLGPNSP